ncbi:MAG: ABC transporter permease, partial [Intestinibacter sp.]
TLRNIFRYKKRFLMTIIGIAGCTSLIIAGCGLRDAIGSMIPSQYGEIFRYNLEISLREGLTTKQTQEAYETISAKENIANSMLINMQSVSIDKNDNNQSIQLVVPQDVEKLKDFITLRDRKHQDETYQLDNSGVIITEKLATLLDIKQGDTIILELGEDNKVEVKVTAITENYLFHYIYMSPELYKQLYEEEIKSNTILAIIPELTLEGEDELGKEILGEEDYISGVTFTSVTTDMLKMS